MATNYLFNTRDHKFIYKEWLDMDKLFSCDAYKDYYILDDIDTYLNLAVKIGNDVPHIRTGPGLSQVHGSSPFTGKHLGEK